MPHRETLVLTPRSWLRGESQLRGLRATRTPSPEFDEGERRLAHTLVGTHYPQLNLRPILPVLSIHHFDEALDVEVLAPAAEQIGVHPIPDTIRVSRLDQADQLAVRDPDTPTIGLNGVAAGDTRTAQVRTAQILASDASMS